MKFKRKNFVILTLSFLLVFVPFFCCCLTSLRVRQDVAYAQQKGAAASGHKCCNSQTKNNQPQNDSSRCDCPNHFFTKATTSVPGSLEALFAQYHSNPYQISFSALVLLNDNPRNVPAYLAVHSPPFKSSGPLYIEFRTLRI